jgi:hypothetical protein
MCVHINAGHLKVKNEWSCTSAPHMWAFMACVGTSLPLPSQVVQVQFKRDRYTHRESSLPVVSRDQKNATQSESPFKWGFSTSKK